LNLVTYYRFLHGDGKGGGVVQEEGLLGFLLVEVELRASFLIDFDREVEKLENSVFIR